MVTLKTLAKMSDETNGDYTLEVTFDGKNIKFPGWWGGWGVREVSDIKNMSKLMIYGGDSVTCHNIQELMAEINNK